MVVGVRIMHPPLNEGCVAHALIKVDNEYRPSMKLIHILLQCFLGELDYLKETLGLLRLSDLQRISLSKPR